ncbi:M23 family metallopeptidase [Marilutibacter alkalisoli]|uniref:Peptidoglycan DD-metalloendopeptidase family protein n=1 Tax=Marilutibacter alkalisoli TaxID=2591633 RepID=A0A514BUM7_9GAMM|nr:M23 family metallopeptidase [Lysobacter alkalisoli]QDH71103.1 peptidoglycan DD-metalloendopeptidase family protein [Lysobacter alkalisoli]
MTPVKRLQLRLSSLVLLGVFVTAAQAAPNFQLPVCGKSSTQWRVSNWKGHNPARAADLNWGSGDADLGKPVAAAAAGTVIKAAYDTNTGYGNNIVIDHGNGWRTRYAHLRSMAVSKGQTVKRGQRIGAVGKSSAKYTFPAHLHYEQIYNGTVRDPIINGVTVAYGTVRYFSAGDCNTGTSTATGTVKTNGANLNVRSGPSTSYSVVGSLANGTKVTIYCQKSGQSITGYYGTSSIWNRIGSGKWIPDAYTYTGSSGFVAPKC